MTWRSTFDIAWTASLLPSNATPWERVIEAVDADLVARNPVVLIPLARSAADAPLELLPYLAAERSVDEFDGRWSEERQRAVTTGSFGYHRTQGTRPALERALNPLGYAVTVVEWFERVDAVPYTFTLSIRIGADQPYLASDAITLVRVVNRAKNAHTKLVALEPLREAPPAMIYVAGLPSLRRTIRVDQFPRLDEIRVSGFAFTGAALTRRRTLRINPRPESMQ